MPSVGRSPSLEHRDLPASPAPLRAAPSRQVLDRQRPEPLWQQLLEDLRRRLDDGEFPDRLPTEAELTATYGVSRQTVREALRRLVA
ncbi:winged helix-turn-helix domain-containing protein, partial [Aciditerrimonas ferrireducens]